MSGETDLKQLLTSIAPQVLPDEYVFCTIKNAKYGDYAETFPLASFLEKEGLTLLITRKSADLTEFKYESIFKVITLTVHSSLDAVGLTAAVSNKLAENGISANVIAAYYHDHILIQVEKVELAIKVLGEFL